ncbi:MAG: ClbS/DfsB family four-helix bundle protein [Chloroflexota bacterium]|nr:ClbS/DfsB family four-helix bundle protein [Chloroflexota bacterium]
MRHTRASVIKRADTEYRALDKIVRQLKAADFRKAAMREAAPIRFTAKDVLAHINAWKWRQARVTAKDKSTEKPYEPPRLRNIKDINAAIYKRSHRTPAQTIVAEHRAAHRAMLKALRAAPPAYFAKRWSANWPFDAVGHVAEHRRKHLEPLLAATARSTR